MMWQDLVFLGGSIFSLIVLAPTIADAGARVPLATSAPSALIGTTYGVAFFTLGMTFSAVGAVATGLMWSLICYLRSPSPRELLGSTEPEPTPEPTSNDATTSAQPAQPAD